MRNQFTFYRSFREALRCLPDEERLAVYDAISDYALDDDEIDIDGVAKAVFLMAKPVLDKAKSKAENGAAGGANGAGVPKQTESKRKANEKQKIANEKQTKANEKQTESKKEIEIEKEIEIDIEKEKRKRFSPPTLEEVRAYCQERKNGIDPQRFIDYYAARGWELKQGQKVKDWQACVRTWERSTERPKERPAASDADLKRMLDYLE